MAIKSQCEQCKHYVSDQTPCGPTGTVPYYNSYSCEHYSRGIVLDKPSDRQQPTTPQQQPSSTPSSTTQPNTGTPKKMFTAVFSFKGRIRRLEFGLTYLAYWFFCLPMNVLSEDEISAGFASIWLLLLIPVVWILLAQRTKRCHDLGYSGWWQLVPFFDLLLIFSKGEPQINQYGAPAK